MQFREPSAEHRGPTLCYVLTESGGLEGRKEGKENARTLFEVDFCKNGLQTVRKSRKTSVTTIIAMTGEGNPHVRIALLSKGIFG